MSVIPGLPPLPECFSAFVGSDTSQWREKGKLYSQNVLQAEGTAKELAQMDKPSTSGTCSNNSQNSDSDTLRNRIENNSNNTCQGSCSSFCQLNSTLSKLKKEMADLRQHDISLLCQLWSLHESIQEYKTVLQDNYSEYSFGTEMSSRASSFSSLSESNEDSDWNDQDYATTDDMAAYGQTVHNSTSSLLQQINELKERVESEFSFC